MTPTTSNDPSAAFKVWHQLHRRWPWRRVASVPSAREASDRMFALMDALAGGDWLVTAPDAADPNRRPAHLRR